MVIGGVERKNHLNKGKPRMPGIWQIHNTMDPKHDGETEIKQESSALT